MSATKSVLSTVFIKSQITATVNGVYPYNPTADVVEAAFVAPGTNPGALDWKAATWETKGTTYSARALVGPGPGAVINLPVGTYRMWVRITDNPEIPVLDAGNVRVV